MKSVGLNFELVSSDAVLLIFKRDFLYSFSVAVQFFCLSFKRKINLKRFFFQII